MTVRFKVQVEGWRELKKRLQLDEMLGPEWRRALDRAAQLVAGTMRERVPEDRGKAKASIKHTLQAKPLPFWARVSVAPKAKRGFRVMGALEGGRIYHYSRGSRAGQQTRGWWSGSLTANRARIEQLIDEVKRKMEARWNRK